jgi:hypothetical protein
MELTDSLIWQIKSLTGVMGTSQWIPTIVTR